MIKSLLAGAAMSLCLVGAASAATYDVIYDGDTADFTATIITDGSDQMISITGFFDDGSGPDAITGFLPGVPGFTTVPGNQTWWWDNEFGAVATWVDWYGILFTTASGVAANLYFDSGNTVLSYNPGNYYPGAIGTLSVAPVPLPAAGLLLVGGIGALGAIKRRRKAA